ncbi:MAG: hypothetical protein A2138_02390 [Deltaproteobacteria bacterium RBG_16_71_12]|nr:MAG: hypothetical protein A2138_02390 [Deltaproteobacteria bacterium RBG_16_71_12]
MARALARTLETRLAPRTGAWGEAFEAFLITEAHRLASYRRPDYRLSYLRTKDDAEVDLVVERPGKRALFVEIKSAQAPDPTEVNRVARLARDHGRAQPMVWCSATAPSRVGEVDVLPWQEALRRVF